MLISCDMGGSYRSLDGGGHWELIHHSQMSSSRSCRPLFLQDASLWASGSVLKTSEDQGATWTAVVSGSGLWGSNSISRLAAIESTPTVLFVGTDTGLWRSPDGGTTWAESLTGTCHGVAVVGGSVFAALDGGGAVFWRSSDSGQTWESVAIAQAGGNALDGITGGGSGGSTVLFATVPGVGTLRSTDEGTNWEVVHGDNGQNDILMATNQTAVVYAAQTGSGGEHVWRTTDGGDTWEDSFRMSGGDANVEQSWVQTEIHWWYYITPLGFGVSPSDPDLVLVSTQGDFYISSDGGESWQQSMNEPVGVLAGDPGFRYRSIGLEVTSCWHYYFDPADHTRRYIAYTDIGFARSVDAGDTWIYSATGCP